MYKKKNYTQVVRSFGKSMRKQLKKKKKGGGVIFQTIPTVSPLAFIRPYTYTYIYIHTYTHAQTEKEGSVSYGWTNLSRKISSGGLLFFSFFFYKYNILPPM
jgi:hypothetical protein